MAAVINPQRFQPERACRSPRPQLVVLEGGRSAAARRQQRTFLRRRLAAVIMLVAFGWAAVSLVGGILGGGEAGAGVPPAAASSRYVVAPGDTLWDVAVSLHVGGDVRDVVDRLAEFNGTDQLVPGQVVEIPSDLSLSAGHVRGRSSRRNSSPSSSHSRSSVSRRTVASSP